MSSLRNIRAPELSKKLAALIKSENHQISAYESASKESQGVASQLSDWGESTEDEAVSDISDKLGVLLSEIAEQEELFAQNLEESRGVLKQIRNIEASVQPTRTHKTKIQDEIQKLKYKEPESTKLIGLEQELVRAEAQSLVAEAQLSNVTRQKFKEAYDLHTAAIVERAEKQLLLAQHARALLNLLDDTPVVPGETRTVYSASEPAREILDKAELSLRSWESTVEPVPSTAGKIGTNAVSEIEQPAVTHEQASYIPTGTATVAPVEQHGQQATAAITTEHQAVPHTTAVVSNDIAPPYPTEEATGNAALAS